MKRLTDDIEKILFTRQQLAERVRELGQQITRDYLDKDLLVIGVLKGAAVFMSDLIREIDLDIRTDYIAVSSYGDEAESSGELRIIKDVSQRLKGYHVLLAEDIIDTGNTLHVLRQRMLDKGAESVKICALLDKPEQRIVPVHADYTGFTVPDGFIVGYGIDLAEKYRNLPFVGILKKEVYELYFVPGSIKDHIEKRNGISHTILTVPL